MKKIKYILLFTIITFFIFFFLAVFYDEIEYKRIGQTNFYLLKWTTMGSFPDGTAMIRLTYSTNPVQGFDNVIVFDGIPDSVLWNDNYMMVYCHDFYSKKANEFYIIRQNVKASMDIEDNVSRYDNRDNFNMAKRELDLEDSKMKHTNGKIPWILHLVRTLKYILSLAKL